MDRAVLLNSNPNIFSFHRIAHGLRHLALAGAITLLLILAMSRLIAADFTEPVLAPHVPIKSIHLPELTVTEEKSEPPVKPQDPPPQRVARVVDTVVDPVNPTLVFNPPLPGGEQVDAAVISRDPLPVFKPAPRYPSAALRRGIEGYVVVEFTITPTGAVRDVRAVAGYDGAGNPTDIFNRSAEAAAARFKYQPQLEDGVPVERHGVRNRISYRLAQ